MQSSSSHVDGFASFFHVLVYRVGEEQTVREKRESIPVQAGVEF
jgi:hypothetical protein